MGGDRGWLTNGTSALLHLAFASIDKDANSVFSSAFCFQRSDIIRPNQYAEDSAARTLLDERNLDLVILRHGDELVRFGDRVKDILYILRSMIEY